MLSYTCEHCSYKFTEESVEALVPKIRAHFIEEHDIRLEDEEIQERIEE